MQTSTTVYTLASKRTTLIGEDHTPMKESAVLGTTCPHCGNDCTSQDAIAAQERIQELEAQVRLFTEKASETALKIANYENELRSMREQAHAWHNNDSHTIQSTSTTSPRSVTVTDNHPPKTPDANAQQQHQQQQQQQQQGRFAGFASYFPYRRTGSRAGSKDSGTPPQTSHSNYSNGSPGRGEHTSPAASTSILSQRSLPSQDLSDSSAVALQSALTREQSLRKAAESQLSQAHSELEELTASLFSQANEMVAQERRARAKLEERVALLEKRDGEKRKRLDRLEKAIARVERVRVLINS